ncbi:MAG: hypothetical protein ACFCVH_15640 [Alphaproteobacteria bacterium]
MRTTRILGSILVVAASLVAGTALADNQPQRLGATPQLQFGQAGSPGLIQLVQCQMGSGDVMARVLIRNNGATAIAPGSQIQWTTSQGSGGVANTGLAGLAPGGVIHVGDAPYPFSCTASVLN